MLKPLKAIYDEEIKKVNTCIKHYNCSYNYNTVKITVDYNNYESNSNNN